VTLSFSSAMSVGNGATFAVTFTELHKKAVTLCHIYFSARDSSVGIATGYGLDDRGVGVQVPVEARIFTSPRRPDRVFGPPNLPSNGCWGLFLRGLSGCGVKLTIHLQLVPRSRKCGSINSLPIRHHCVMLN
jgi:hypothetical protein